MKNTGLKSAAALVSGIVLLTVFGCGSGKGGTTTTTDNAATRLAPAALFGGWRLSGTSGGFSGGGFGVPDRSVTFEKNGMLTRRDGTTTTRHRYRVDRKQTNLGTDPFLVIVEDGKGSGLAIIQCDNAQLSLAEEGGSDGYDYVYNREAAASGQ